jgi:hypothetical protein
VPRVGGLELRWGRAHGGRDAALGDQRFRALLNAAERLGLYVSEIPSDAEPVVLP